MPRVRERQMVEKRDMRRRRYLPHTRFPLHNYKCDLIKSERRRIPTRRLNDIEVKDLSCEEFFCRITVTRFRPA
jgi:hypothetical protein